MDIGGIGFQDCRVGTLGATEKYGWGGRISFAFGSLVSGGCAAFGSNLSRLSSFVQGERNLANMAGAEGFEPSHDGIKTRCLTAWLRPSRFGPLLVGKQRVHRRLINALGNKTL